MYVAENRVVLDTSVYGTRIYEFPCVTRSGIERRFLVDGKIPDNLQLLVCELPRGQTLKRISAVGGTLRVLQERYVVLDVEKPAFKVVFPA